MKFIRKGGRIIPIRDKGDGKPGDHIGGKMVAAGVVNGAIRRSGFSTMRMMNNFKIHKKIIPGAGSRKGTLIAAAVVSGVASGANIYNSYKHGQKEGVGKGVRRYLANSFYFFGGTLLGGAAAQGAISGLAGARRTGIFSKIGNVATRTAGKTADLLTPKVKKGVSLKKFKGKTFRSHTIDKISGLIGYDK